MEFSSTEPRLSSYLHARACRSGTPLAGNFELTARCNFNCKMCYVHLTAEEQQRRGRELTAEEWLAIAQEYGLPCDTRFGCNFQYHPLRRMTCSKRTLWCKTPILTQFYVSVGWSY